MTLDFAEPALDGGASRRIDPAFHAHYLTIFRLCMRQLGDPCDAEDAVQETFRRALQQRGAVVGDPLPWLITVARNVCIDELRRRRYGHDALMRSAGRAIAADAEGDGVTNPEGVVVGRMFVNELLDCLTPAERRVMAGTIVNGQCGGDLAASLGVTASTARVLLARARGKLRRYLEDGKAAVTGAGFAGWRGAERLRQRLLSHPLALQARPEMLLPALVITAVVSGATGAPAIAHTAGGGGTAVHPLGLADVRWADARSLGHGSLATEATLASSSGTGSRRAGSPAAKSPGSPLSALFPAPDPDQVWVTDFEASPDYASDHTVYMVGTGNCTLTCSQLFRSQDGGATWTYVPTAGLQSSQLLIPSSGYAAGRFFGAGGNLLQVTSDGGRHFRNQQAYAGFVTAAPAWMGAQVITSDVALSLLGSSPSPTVVAVYGPGESAAGAPLLMPSDGRGGFTALQLVQNYVTGGADTLLRCDGGGCTTLAQVPLPGTAALIASPGFAVDRTLVALGDGVAVSRDGGVTFTRVSSDLMYQAIAIPGPSGTRLVAVDATRATSADDSLVYSDDWGSTWHSSTLDGGSTALQAHTVRWLAPGRLIASAADPSRAGAHIFICSDDGGAWSGCAPDGN